MDGIDHLRLKVPSFKYLPLKWMKGSERGRKERGKKVKGDKEINELPIFASTDLQ